MDPTPTLNEDLAEGLSLQMGNGRYVLRRKWHAQDLTGDTPVETFASALSLEGAPQYRDEITVLGRTLYCTKIDLNPWPPADAEILATYEDLGTVEISGGTVLQQEETDFDYSNLQKPLAEREPIFVEYDPESNDDVGATALKPQGARVPILVARSSITFARIEVGDPTDNAADFGGRTNSATWKGLPANTCLMVEVRFHSTDSGQTFQVSYTVALDLKGKWKQGARYRLDTGEFPKLSPTQVAADNGYKEVVVQGERDFNLLDL